VVRAAFMDLDGAIELFEKKKSDVRGMIDIAVGSALMNGAIFYFRAILKKEKASPINK
jgi:hypothetical protein